MEDLLGRRGVRRTSGLHARIARPAAGGGPSTTNLIDGHIVRIHGLIERLRNGKIGRIDGQIGRIDGEITGAEAFGGPAGAAREPPAQPREMGPVPLT